MDEKTLEIIKGYLDRAQEKLKSAKDLIKAGDWSDCVSRAYYCVFHAAQAILLSEGLSSDTHHGLVSLFGLHFVKKGKFDRRYAKILTNLKDDRETGDYEVFSTIDEEMAQEAIREAEEFLEEAMRYLSNTTLIEKERTMIQPFVSIIVPVRNAGRTLDKTFEYLMNVEYPRDKMEIVIADGGSTDNTVEIIKNQQNKYPFIRLVEIPNCPSPGFARNKALDAAKGEFLFFTDGDCAPCKEWITEMLKQFERDPKIGAVGGEIYTLRVDPNNLTELYCENFGFNRVSWRYGNLQESYYPDLTDMSPSEICGHRAYFFVTANVAYRKEAIDKLGARFWTHPTGEDMEFGLKFRKSGWKFYFVPKASVDHMHRADLKALNKVWASYGKGHLPLIKENATKHMEIILEGHKIKPRIKIPGLIKGFIYIGDFQLMHLFGLTTIIGLIFDRGIFTLISLILTIFFAYRFFYWCWYMKPRKHFFIWCKMKYLTNLYFIKGAFKGWWKYKVFCVEPSF